MSRLDTNQLILKVTFYTVLVGAHLLPSTTSAQERIQQQPNTAARLIPSTSPEGETRVQPTSQLTPTLSPLKPSPEQAVASGLKSDPLTPATPGTWSAALRIVILMTILTLAPSILIMTTCFIRFVIVFGLLRQALGTQQLPPNQVLISLALFMTALVMWPIWQEAYDQGWRPYVTPHPDGPRLSEQEAWQRIVAPLRRFMAEQIDRVGHAEAIWLFLDFQRHRLNQGGDDPPLPDPTHYDQVPLTVLLPAYMLSELKVSFLIGFQLFLPFLVIDLVIAALLISMGMMMLPPVLISLPIKLLLFVLADGWTLTVGMLLESVVPP